MYNEGAFGARRSENELFFQQKKTAYPERYMLREWLSDMILALIRRHTPRLALIVYHRVLAFAAALFYGFPSTKLVVIGVTGTKGKSTTSILIASLLEHLGASCGYTSTIGFKVGSREWLNDKKMTMLGRFANQKLLRHMVRAGATHAIIETSSEGIVQSRHRYINYDVGVFTNLTPEHIESHGSFENYRAAKETLFSHLTERRHKTIQGKRIPKIIIANADDEESTRILNVAADEKITFGTSRAADIRTEDICLTTSGASFTIQGTEFGSPLLGQFNVMNATSAIATVYALGHPLSAIASVMPRIQPAPGRQELVNEGQPFTVMVDYAYEPESQRQLYELIHTILKPSGNIIHVTGSAGGGRDQVRRSVLGRMAGAHADTVIVTDEDPYDEDPQKIIAMVAAGAREAGMIENQNLFSIIDRRLAIEKALTLAQPQDFVLITGKGSETAMCVANGVKIPWDDRAVVRELLKARSNDKK